MSTVNEVFQSLPYNEPTEREIVLAKTCRRGYYRAIDGLADDDEWNSLSPDERYSWIVSVRYVLSELAR